MHYEDLPAVFDPEAALAESAPQLHPEHPGNQVARYRTRKGDMAAGWAAADVVVEGEYETTWQEHAYLQPEAGLAYIDEEDRVTVLVAGQWTHEDQEQIYHALDLPPEKVRVIYPAIGGAFGGREDMSVQIILAPGRPDPCAGRSRFSGIARSRSSITTSGIRLKCGRNGARPRRAA